MKRVLAVVLVMFIISGCANISSELDRTMRLRNRLLNGDGCTFDAVITADYGEKFYTFSLKCQSDRSGNVVFEVIQPETISGITGTITEDGGKLTFDDQALAFELLADGQITPVSAPWIMLHTLRGGYINACGRENDGLYIQIDDSYSEGNMHVDFWTDAQDKPVRAEIIYQGKRIVSIDVENFTFL